MSGVLMALFITDTTLSVMSLLGSIMLIGIVVKNGIVLIDYTILCRERGIGAECRGYGRQEPSPSGVDDDHDYHSRYDSDGHQQRSGF